MVRKYWLGWSDEESHKPEDFETGTVESEDELNDLQARFAELMAEDYLNEIEGDDEG